MFSNLLSFSPHNTLITIALRCILFYSIALHFNVLYSIALYSTPLCSLSLIPDISPALSLSNENFQEETSDMKKVGGFAQNVLKMKETRVHHPAANNMAG